MCVFKRVFLISFVFAVLISQASAFTKAFDPNSDKEIETREIRIKQGRLRGFVYEPSTNRHMQKVEVYLGLPYAAPPTGSQRLMPPGSPPSWSGIKKATTFGNVCPQKLPDISAMKVSEERRKYLKRLLPYLKPQYQSEDCLYLNIYTPYQGNNRVTPKHPVMVFIHGESFEWNSGNAYDGCALASYGHVVVVTFNFRLGILGFLRPVVNQDTIGNFGLLDQIAALQWVQENIAAFGGDPGSVTIMGHGTGAACANYLLVSPVTEKVQGLFHRAILMSGTALSDWALTRNPIDYTIQVAHALNCPATAELLTCLRKKRLKEIMNITVHASQFITPFGPVVDGNTVPNEPKPLMGKYNDLFSRYELLYGVTQLESLPLLDPVALQFGQNKEQRYQVLRDYLKERYPVQPDIAVASTLQAYTSDWGRHMESTEHRNMVLDILTDARVASPIIQTANYHCIANPKSYLYVFTHRSQFGYYSETTLDRSVHGEELPYVFGLPIDGGDQQPHHFSEQEELLAEAVVTYWTNFAKTGNPNAPHRTSFLSQTFRHWVSFDVQWPEYDRVNQSYLDIGIPPKINRHYRGQEMKFWNKILPETLNQSTATPSYPLYPTRPERPPWDDIYPPPPPPPRYKPSPPPPPPFIPETPTRYQTPTKRYPPTIPPPRKSTLPTKDPNDGYVIDPPSIVDEKQTSNLADSSSVALTIVIIIGVCFLLVNLCAFAALYYKRDKLKVQEELMKRKYEDLRLNDLEDDDDVYMKGRRRQEIPDGDEKDGKKKKKMFDSGVGGLGDDDYEAIRSAGKTLESTGVRGHEGRIVLGSSKPGEEVNAPSGGASGSGMKKWALSRQCSASTMDPNTKVREWIAHEVIQRCSPRFNRRMMKSPQLQMQPSTSIDTSIDQMSYQQHQPHASPHPILVHTPKPVIPMNTLQRSKAKKISVAVDATPAARSASLQKQLSTEQHMSKSMDELGTCVSTSSITLRKPALKRSATTVEDLTTPTMSNAPSSRSTSPRDITRRSTTNISLQMGPQVTEIQGSSDVLCINHQHSKSDPITSPFRENDPQRQIYPHVVNITLESKGAMPSKQIRSALKKNASVTTDSSEVINVTSRDSGDDTKSQTSGDPLTNIQRRNFPKVLPDFPQEDGTCEVNDGDDRDLSTVQSATAKRRSLPSNSHLLVGLLPPVYESGSASQPTTPTAPVQSFKEFQQQFSAKVPPPPPPRVSSTLGRKPSNTSPLSPPSPSVVTGPPRSPTSGQPRPEPRVVIKPTLKSPITGKAPIKTKNNQPIPRVTPNNPDALLTQPPSSQQQRRQPPIGQSVSTAAGPTSIPKGEITVRPVGGKIQQKSLQEKVVGSEKSSTSTSTSSELDDSSSNTGTVKRVKKPGTPGTPAKETSTQPQDNKPATQHPPKNWYTKYNKSFLSKSKDKD
ncbi:uncharacterized protein [Anabrus simplex]|uniref:uncharacterized protein n=1 Tax=Anabrus simplex TaxID=316456 RepID=UPI0035A3A563